MDTTKKSTVKIITFCSILIAVLLVLSTLWMGTNSKKDTDKAVRTVSLLYLDELAGRREKVVANNLNGNIDTIRVAMDLLTEEDLSDKAHLSKPVESDHLYKTLEELIWEKDNKTR